MAELTVGIELYCNECDTELIVSGIHGETIYVAPCEHCADKAYNKGFIEGGHKGD